MIKAPKSDPKTDPKSVKAAVPVEEAVATDAAPAEEAAPTEAPVKKAVPSILKQDASNIAEQRLRKKFSPAKQLQFEDLLNLTAQEKEKKLNEEQENNERKK